MGDQHGRGFDPLDDLRAAWRSLEAPAPTDELADADPRTRRAVEWMRAAWATVEPERELAPPRPVPVAAPRLLPPPVLLRLAAAILVATLAALLWWRPDGSAAVEEGAPGLTADSDAPSAPDRRVPEPERVPEQPVLEHVVQFASLSSEKLEMRSGPVRLVLLTGGGQTADGGARNDSSEEER